METLAPNRGLPAPQAASHTAASVVIPNWNGKDLLAKYLPSVIQALAGNPCNEIVVVDDASTDGSADFLRAQFPQVHVVALPRNHGFGGCSNAGFQAARNDVVVLLNSDMRVDTGFPRATARRLCRSRSLRRFLPDFLQRSGQTPRRNRPHARLVAGR